jgi:hypothetical protein
LWGENRFSPRKETGPMSGIDVLALSQEQGEAAADAVLSALLEAGPDGLSPGDLVLRSGIAERRVQRATKRLESRGAVRRDGKRRIFAVMTSSGELVPANDAASRAESDRERERELAYRRGWVLGEIGDTRTLLDGRTLPVPAGARAAAARGYLAELERDVRACRSTDEIDRLTEEFSPIVGEVSALLRAVGEARHDAERAAADAARALVEVDARIRQLRTVVRELERIGHAWIRSAQPIRWYAFRAKIRALEQATDTLFVEWGVVAHWTEDTPPPRRLQITDMPDLASRAGRDRLMSEIVADQQLARTRVVVRSHLDRTLSRYWDLRGTYAVVPDDAPMSLSLSFALDLVRLAAAHARGLWGDEERRKVELTRKRKGGPEAVSQALHARLGRAPILEGGPPEGMAALGAE